MKGSDISIKTFTCIYPFTIWVLLELNKIIFNPIHCHDRYYIPRIQYVNDYKIEDSGNFVLYVINLFSIKKTNMIHYKMISAIFFWKNVLSFGLLEKIFKQCSQFVCVGIFRLSYQNHIIVATSTFKWYSFLRGNVTSFNLSESIKNYAYTWHFVLSVDASVVFVWVTDAPNLLYRGSAN